MNRWITCLITMLPLVAWGADKSPDRDFFKHAAEGGIAEVDAGKLAESKAESPAVKDFAAMMVKDHSDANAKLQSLAATKNIDLPSSLDAKQAASKAKLEALKGGAFDKAYIRNQIAGHEETAALFKKEIASGTDSQAKAFAKETLPTVEAHLKKIRQIASESGVETK